MPTTPTPLGGEAACQMKLEGDAVVRRARTADAAALTAMRQALFPHESAEELRSEVPGMLGDDGSAVLVAEAGDGALVGYAQVGTRPYVDGCRSSPVGYLEEWWVAPELRRHGIGRLLVEAGERWAAARGCTEMASDTTLDNTLSQAAHERLGYEETDRIVQYRKALRPSGPTESA